MMSFRTVGLKTAWAVTARSHCDFRRRNPAVTETVIRASCISRFVADYSRLGRFSPSKFGFQNEAMQNGSDRYFEVFSAAIQKTPGSRAIRKIIHYL